MMTSPHALTPSAVTHWLLELWNYCGAISPKAAEGKPPPENIAAPHRRCYALGERTEGPLGPGACFSGAREQAWYIETQRPRRPASANVTGVELRRRRCRLQVGRECLQHRKGARDHRYRLVVGCARERDAAEAHGAS